MKTEYRSASGDRRIVNHWHFNKVGDRVEFAPSYIWCVNFWVHATMQNGELVIDNPRKTLVPAYALSIVKDMFAV